jgi:hypothetical protein
VVTSSDRDLEPDWLAVWADVLAHQQQMSGLLQRLDQLREVAGDNEGALLEQCARQLRSGEHRLQELAAVFGNTAA